jgi:hypothetical protein
VATFIPDNNCMYASYVGYMRYDYKTTKPH